MYYLIIGQTAIGIKKAGALLTAQSRNRRNYLQDAKGDGREPEGQVQEYRCLLIVADQPVVAMCIRKRSLETQTERRG